MALSPRADSLRPLTKYDVFDDVGNHDSVAEIENVEDIFLGPKFAVEGFSDVYAATWKNRIAPGAVELVAVKVLRFVGIDMNTPSTDQPALETGLARIDKRLGREMYTWRRLCDYQEKHNLNYVTPLLGYVKSTNRALGDGNPCLVSMYRANGNLEAYLMRNPDVDRLQLLVDAAKGLNFLHTFNPPIAHLDVKPKNILIDDKGLPEYCDFGLSKALEDVRTGFTTASTSTGPIRYSAPELLDDSPAKSPAADIFSFGGVILFTLSNKHPFENIRAPGQILRSITNGLYPEREYHGFEGPEEAVNSVWNLMYRCWSVKPTDRPSAKDVLDELERILKSTLDV